MLHDQVRLGLQLQRALKDPHLMNQSLLSKLIGRAEQSIKLRQWKSENLPQINYPPLPVSDRREEIVKAIRNHQVLVIAGETGSGKTTQLPKMCLEAGLGVRAQIGCTQPRRVAAMSLSRRLAEELDIQWGQEVGCKIRFSDHSRPETFIKMMTDGILLAEIQTDPFLCEYDVILVDEAHERSLNIDFLLGYLRQLTQKRDDLKVIITSATIDTAAFSAAFGNAPIIEVSGRTYPVEVNYCEVTQSQDDEDEDLRFVDMAVAQVDEIIHSTYGGDILVFMPSERDIRETVNIMEGRHWKKVEVLPLFGRQTSGEQQEVFALSPLRRVVVATNIAETSLTIPNIHFVVDTGLARISRYNSRTRTKRLPIEMISQSSANQRKGRCGRVAEGICYRLYSEADFNELQPYTQPEIQRANLAEVILRMRAFRLGEIETFPFINPPTSQAIHAGYSLLQELGALDETRNLTRMGMELARMAVDPSIGRMILQAREEGVLEEMLVIASGLSIQDPRERPTELRAQAETAHKAFNDPESDFITLLNLWKAWRKAWSQLRTENQVRKFCRSNFISFVRMREWGDLYEQLRDTLDEMRKIASPSIDRKNPTLSGLSDAARIAIHRSILSGLLGHIAQRKERNMYNAVGNREVMIFPGSGLFNKTAANGNKKSKTTSPSQVAKVAQPEWIVAGELLETSRLFVRTVAGIDISWVEDIAPHICKTTYHDAHWSEKEERVLVLQRVTAHGFLIKERWVDYGHVKPEEATDIFIRMALVEEEGGLKRSLKFLEHNRKLSQKLELWQSHAGRLTSQSLSEAIATNPYEKMRQFYAERIQNVSSIHDLNRILKENNRKKDFLFATEKELLGDQFEVYDSGIFPDQVQLAGHAVEARYAYAPGKDIDGVTLRIPIPLLPVVKREEVDWSVPGFRQARWEQLLDALPRNLRRRLMPIRDRAARLALEIQGVSGNELEKARLFILREWGVDIPPSAWTVDKIPDYLTPKIEVVSEDKTKVFSGINLENLQLQIKEHAQKEDRHEWQEAAAKWEIYGLSDWPKSDDGRWKDIPESITLKKVNGIPLQAFPGLEAEDGQVNLRLFRSPLERDKTMNRGLTLLAEHVMSREFAWTRRDFRQMTKAKLLYAPIGNTDELEEMAYTNFRNYVLSTDESPRLTHHYFDVLLWEARHKLKEALSPFIALVTEILELRQQVLLYPKPFVWMKKELNVLVSPKFLSYTPFVRLQHLPRYLKMLLTRAARAQSNPSGDVEKTRRVEPWQTQLDELLKKKNIPQEARNKLWELFWLVQEFKVSCYAQELGTSEAVSPQKLANLVVDIRKYII